MYLEAGGLVLSPVRYSERSTVTTGYSDLCSVPRLTKNTELLGILYLVLL